MIVTELEHADRQAPPTPALGRALEFLRRPGLAGLPDGKYEIDGERIFALVQRYRTAAESGPRFEGHRRFIDVQYLVSGAEVIGWAPLARLRVTEAYDAAGDICFGAVAEGEWTPVRLAAGQLAVLYPEDAHAPKLAAGAPGPVMKVVVKVAVQ